MKQAKKTVSLFLAVVFSAICACVPLSVCADEEAAYTVESKDTLTRFIPKTKAFTDGETKTFDFTPSVTADYALFMDAATDKNNTVTTFAVKKADDGTAVSFTWRDALDPSSTSSGETYSYTHQNFQYEKVGNISELKVSLTADTTYTLSVSRTAALSSLNYIDIRCLTLPITGGKQAIAPQDASVFTTTTVAHMNEQLKYTDGVALPEGYALIGDYTDNSVFTNAFGAPRYIHISNGSSATYTLDVQKTGYYRVSYRTRTWKSENDRTNGATFSFNVPFYVDGTLKDTLVWSQTLTADKEPLQAKLLTAEPVYLDADSHTITFGNVTDGSYALSILIEELENYDPNATGTLTMETAPVKVDNILSRFELSENITLSSAGHKYAFSFTPAADGEYVFFLNNAKTVAVPVVVTVTDDDSKKVFEYNYTTTGKTQYERVGNAAYQAASLKANKEYTITLAGTGDAFTMGYFDVRCVNPLTTPSEGKFAVSPSDFVVTDIDTYHANEQFNSRNYKNTEYPMLGNYYSTELTSPRDKATTIHLGNGKYITYALDVTTPGYFTLTLPTVDTYPGNAKAERITLSVNGEKYDTQGWTDSAADLVFKSVYLYKGVNRITLTNETVSYTDGDTTYNGKNVGAYIKSLLFDQQASDPEPTKISGDTMTDSYIPLISMTSSEGTPTRDAVSGTYSLKNGDSMTYTVNVEEKGTYAVYVDAQIPQKGVQVFVDNEDKTSAMYLTIEENCVKDGNTRQTRKLSFPVDLDEGTHTIKLSFKNGLKYDSTATTKVVEITDDDNYSSLLYSLWMRRTDLTASVDEEMFLRSWDFSSVSYVNEETDEVNGGWCFPHQHKQGGPFTVGSFTDCRSVVFIDGRYVTYKVNIPESGRYSFSTFIKGATDVNTYTMTVNGKTYSCVVAASSDVPMKSIFDPVFLAAGTYDVTFTAPSYGDIKGTLRLYGISVGNQAEDFVAVGEDSAYVSVSFDKGYTGEVVTAFYSASNQLVGLKTESVSNAESYSAEVALSDTPTKAKVFVWGDLTNVAPLRSAVELASGDATWISE